jgi:hypothetical protein
MATGQLKAKHKFFEVFPENWLWFAVLCLSVPYNSLTGLVCNPLQDGYIPATFTETVMRGDFHGYCFRF